MERQLRHVLILLSVVLAALTIPWAVFADRTAGWLPAALIGLLGLALVLFALAVLRSTHA